MKRAIGSPNKAQQKRQDIIRELGCVCCMLDGHMGEPCEIQHMNSCGRNIGHDFTFGMCSFHHRGVGKNGMTTPQMTQHFGPSFAIDKAAFRARYGTDSELLVVQNVMIENYLGICDGTATRMALDYRRR